jgi:hypothetical protein
MFATLRCAFASMVDVLAPNTSAADAPAQVVVTFLPLDLQSIHRRSAKAR